MSWLKKFIKFITPLSYVEVRTRNKKGRYIADDPATIENEAYKKVLRKNHYLLKGNNMSTIKESFAKIAAHERECTIRYENIEKRLDQGQRRFNKLDNMIWGLYILMITSGVLAGMFG
jgi:hypothetical protein